MAKARTTTKANTASAEVAFIRHDHRRCRRSAIQAVESLCEERSLRLTPARLRTLEILLESHEALGAYQVLEKLSASGYGEKPPQVYRALSFLIEQGFAHKIERLNAFVACTEPLVCCNPCFLVCDDCGRVAERSVPTASKQLAAAANQLGFSTQESVIELAGTCKQCEDMS